MLKLTSSYIYFLERSMRPNLLWKQIQWIQVLFFTQLILIYWNKETFLLYVSNRVFVYLRLAKTASPL